MSKPRKTGKKTSFTPNNRSPMRFKKGSPNNSRCPKCQAKLKRSGFAISCGRCGYRKLEEEDHLTKAFYYL